MTESPWKKDGNKIPEPQRKPFTGDDACEEIQDYVHHRLNQLIGEMVEDSGWSDMEVGDKEHFLMHMTACYAGAAGALAARVIERFSRKELKKGKQESIDFMEMVLGAFHRSLEANLEKGKELREMDLH